MTSIPFKSVNLKSSEYDAATHTLILEFANGRRYEYLGVLGDVYEGLLAAPSAGKYFFGVIRGHYETREVTV